MIDTILTLPVSLAVCAWTLAYTPPNSKLRLLAGLTIAVCNWIAAQSTVAKYFPGFIAAEYMLGWILASNNWLNLARLHYKPPAKGYEESNAREKWAIYQIFDTRWSVHPSQIPFFDKNRPQWTPSKRYFLLWKVWTISWCALLFYGAKKFEPMQLDDLTQTPSGFIYRLSDMSLRETWLRTYYGLEVMVSAYCTLCLMHAVCGFVAVAVFQDDPAGWRPLHGSPREALGMRGFYKTFWHHCMRKGFTTHAVFLVNKVLRLPRKSPISRYLTVIFTFYISGLYHAALTSDIPWQCSVLQIGYQTKIIAAIFFEDVVAMLWHRFAPRSLRLDNDEQEDLTTSSTVAKSTSIAAMNGKTELRRRNETTDLKEYPRSPMPTTPTTSVNLEHKVKRLNGISIILHGIIYLWTICFIIYANSTLVYATNQCVVEHIFEAADQEAYFEEHGFNEPM